MRRVIAAYDDDPIKKAIKRANDNAFIIPDTSTISALRMFVNYLRSAGIYGRCDYLRVSAMNNVNYKDFCRINLANPLNGNLATLGTSTVYNASGFKGNKTLNGALRIGMQVSDFTKITPDSATLLYVLATATTQYTGYYEISGVPNLGGRFMTISNANNTGSNLFGLPSVAINLSGTGLKALTKSDNTRAAFNKDVVIPYTAGNGSFPVNRSFQFYENLSNNAYAEATFSLSIIGSYLTESEVEFIREKFNIYLTTIGLAAFA